MGVISKMFTRINKYATTVFVKSKWKKALELSDTLNIRKDTEIKISGNGHIKIDHNVWFNRNVSLISAGGFLQIGNNVSINRNCIIVCQNSIIIGDDVSIGPGVTIYDHNHVFSTEGIRPGFHYGEVVIEKGCWIAANVTILRNTHIGEGCVIGAGAVVKGNIPSHSIVTADRELHIAPIVNKNISNC